jgi:hypothetical protein
MFSLMKLKLSCLQYASAETINEGQYSKPSGGLLSSIGGGKYNSDTLDMGENKRRKLRGKVMM